MNNDIPNWFDYPALYAQLAEQIPDGMTFVEVGSWVGHSISYFAREIKRHGKKNVRIVAVDTFKGSANDPLQIGFAADRGGSYRHLFDATLAEAGVLQMVEAIEADSVAASAQFKDGTVWGVFIDGEHTTEAVLRDIAAWKPKLMPQGTLCGHDIDQAEVNAAVVAALGPCQTFGRCWVYP
jgi:cephalosporin hydroxylase